MCMCRDHKKLPLEVASIVVVVVVAHIRMRRRRRRRRSAASFCFVASVLAYVGLSVRLFLIASPRGGGGALVSVQRLIHNNLEEADFSGSVAHITLSAALEALAAIIFPSKQQGSDHESPSLYYALRKERRAADLVATNEASPDAAVIDPEPITGLTSTKATGAVPNENESAVPSVRILEKTTSAPRDTTAKMCVRHDGEFVKPFHDPFTGGLDELNNVSSSVFPANGSSAEARGYKCVSGGPVGTTVLWARGGLGNQLHCMAALQRLDPEWMALDHTPRPYLTDEFARTRMIPEEKGRAPNETIRRRGGVSLFPFIAADHPSTLPGNCWRVAAFEGDACGPEEEALVPPNETLRARTIAAFAALPIEPRLKFEAKVFVSQLVKWNASKKRPLIAVHTRTGSLLVDGMKRWNLAQLEARHAGTTEWNYRGKPPLNFDTTRLVVVVLNESRKMRARTGLAPVVLLASDNPLVARVLSYRLRERTPNEWGRRHRFDDDDDDEFRVVLTRRLFRAGLEKLENDMLELLAISHADLIIKDNYLRESTFSEAAWWLGGATARRIFTPNSERILLLQCLRHSTEYNRPTHTAMMPTPTTSSAVPHPSAREKPRVPTASYRRLAS